MSQIGRPVHVKIVPLLLQTLNRAGLREFLSGKDKNDVSPFITQWHAVGERILSRDPADVYPHRLILPGACHVKVLVTQCLDHLEELSFRAFARHPGD